MIAFQKFSTSRFGAYYKLSQADEIPRKKLLCRTYILALRGVVLSIAEEKKSARGDNEQPISGFLIPITSFYQSLSTISKSPFIPLCPTSYLLNLFWGTHQFKFVYARFEEAITLRAPFDTRDKIVNIDAAGDIILVVGPEKLRLRVKSIFLKTASKLPGTILGPDWKENHILVTGLPVEIILPEENAMALRCICAILHHQNRLLPQVMAVNDVLRIAVAANKFGVVDALTFASEFWLSPVNKGASDLIVLAAAASLFKNAQAFRDITKALVLNYGDSYLALLSEDVRSILGDRVFCLLEKQRGFARLKLGEILIGGINALGYGVNW
ncbi:hypothetical protein DTO027I6_3236 [Penicillium roqueforti]|nr:hypothetical protein CBS147337_8526 [Penicillium roqueforti]KAI3171556.1 hypothetical protein CBS147317_985 [Penicillium roqueforti]KAI3215632.1 hypothetical protein DTO027I6_3236 [Penicillium roqueforti]KAI3231686.1 hypothetical protein DTO012A7_5297 [Penicillium roqueforti]KAI3264614.1 hypothetical protein CBS147309_6552 [Penicillium roqueforti]